MNDPDLEDIVLEAHEQSPVVTALHALEVVTGVGLKQGVGEEKQPGQRGRVGEVLEL